MKAMLVSTASTALALGVLVSKPAQVDGFMPAGQCVQHTATKSAQRCVEYTHNRLSPLGENDSVSSSVGVPSVFLPLHLRLAWNQGASSRATTGNGRTTAGSGNLIGGRGPGGRVRSPNSRSARYQHNIGRFRFCTSGQR